MVGFRKADRFKGTRCEATVVGNRLRVRVW